MMGLLFKNKKAAKAALLEQGSLGPEVVVETSMFGPEFVDGKHAVCVSLDPYTVRNYFAEVTIERGRIVSIK